MGATNDGKLVAAESELVYEAGAFSGSPVGAGARNMLAPYVIPHVLVDGYDVVNNKPSSSAYRAPGTTNAAFAVETVVDELAEKLGVDPLEFRLDNSAKEGTRRADGPVNKRIGHEECVRAAVSSDHYQTVLNGKYRGRGVASGFWGNGGGVSSAAASVNDDGTINLVEGSTGYWGHAHVGCDADGRGAGYFRAGDSSAGGRYGFDWLYGCDGWLAHDICDGLGGL